MKYSFRRSLMALLVAGVASLSSCSAHHHGQAKMKDITGIYQLTECKEKLEDETEVNLIETEQIKCYFVIDGSEFGVAYYKDANIEKFSQVYVDYEVNEEKSTKRVTKYSSVTLNWGDNTQMHAKGYHPGYKEPAYGIWERSHTLSYSQLSSNVFGNKRNHISVTYKRVSEETSFEKFKQVASITGEKPANFLLRDVVNKTFIANSGDLSMLYPTLQQVKIRTNENFDKVYIKSLAADLEDVDSNYSAEVEHSVSSLTKVNMDDNPTLIGYKFTINGETPIGNNPSFTLAVQKADTRYPNIWIDVNGTRLSFFREII